MQGTLGCHTKKHWTHARFVGMFPYERGLSVKTSVLRLYRYGSGETSCQEAYDGIREG